MPLALFAVRCSNSGLFCAGGGIDAAVGDVSSIGSAFGDSDDVREDGKALFRDFELSEEAPKGLRGAVSRRVLMTVEGAN